MQATSRVLPPEIEKMIKSHLLSTPRAWEYADTLMNNPKSLAIHREEWKRDYQSQFNMEKPAKRSLKNGFRQPKPVEMPREYYID